MQRLVLIVLTSFLLLLLTHDSEQCGFSMGSSGGGCCSPPPVMNMCCSGGGGGGGGGGGCRCRTKRRVTVPRLKRDVRQHVTSLHDSDFDDPICNNSQLKQTMTKHMVGDPSISRELIHQAITDETMVHFAVVCSLQSFNYVVDSKLYCQNSNTTTGETCYAFEF